MVGALLLAWALAVTAASALAIRRRSAMKSEGCTRRPLLLVRPCAGLEAGLHGRLVSVARARPPAGPFTLGFSVADPTDAALPELEAAAAELRAAGLDVEVRVVDPGDAPNRKAAQLATWLAATPREGILACVDSDVDLTDFPLDSLTGPLDDLAVGATWAAAAEQGGTTPGDRASAAFLGASLHAFALLGALDRRGLVGKVFAVRAEAMAIGGGFEGLEHTLGEDMEIARRLAYGGYRSELVPVAARAFPSGRSRAAVVVRFARWLAVIRAQRPALLASYPLLFGATAPLVMLGLVVPGSLATGAAALAVVTRLGVAHAARGFNGLPRKPLILLRDLLEAEWLTWAAFLQALRSREVEWRGRRLRIAPGGRLELVP